MVKRYLTTTLPYVNAAPHVGFALEIVQADCFARFRSLLGDEVFFNTGTDEHGQKIYEKALAEGKDPQNYTDEFAAKFQELKGILNLSPEIHFIRTTNEQHKLAAQEIWRRCLAQGDIYKKKYKGLYCVGDEMFLRESDLVDGKCPNHPTMDPVTIEEENYFFRLSAYSDKLLHYLSNEKVIIPPWRRQEAIQFVEKGLEDFSISRDKERLSWGVPVPEDDSQVMYVWFDALTNYISTLGWPNDDKGDFTAFWEKGEVLQFAGKDQVRFQSIMWQAMLLSAGVKNTDTVFYHGFITSGGQKMSKSLGNVIDPLAIVREYGTDALRYYLLRHVHPVEDSDMTMEKFHEAYTANLVNGVGNLTSRIMKMAQTHLDGPVALPEYAFPEDFVDALNRFSFNEAADSVWKKIAELDEHIQTTEPFKLVKTDREKAVSIIVELVQGLHTVACLLEPLLPETSEKIKAAILANTMQAPLFPRKEQN